MPKFNFIKNREKLSDKEIESKMNFNEFMKGYQSGNAGLSKAAGSLKLLRGIAVIAAFTGIVYLTKNISSKNEKPPLVNPPMEDVRINPNTYTINNSRDTVITYKTGSSIYIPASSFIDISGNDAKGNIEIRYREFHNSFDLFLSGIPMGYDSAGTTYQLETGGMLECLAFQNNKPLNLKPGKEITVNMISQTTDDNFNIYYLDTVKRNWEFISANTRANNTNTPLFDENTVKEYEATVNHNIEPAVPSIAKRTSPNIELDYSKEEFPELAVFEGIKFEIDPSDKNFDPSLANKTWDDVAVKKGVNAKQYVLTFTKGTETHDFVVSPVLEEKDYEKAQQEYIRKQEEYFTLLDKKKKNEKYREQVMQSNYNKLTNVAQWSNVNKRVKDFLSKDVVNYGTLAARTFNMQNLGIWNCDRPLSERIVDIALGKAYVPKQVQKCDAFFTDKRENVIELKVLYFIPDSLNTIYSFPVNGNTAKIAFLKEAGYKLLAVTTDGLPAYVSSKEFRDMSKGEGDLNFKLTVSDKQIKDAQSLKSFMQMN